MRVKGDGISLTRTCALHVDNDELRISFSSDNIPPSLINQKIKLIVGVC